MANTIDKEKKKYTYVRSTFYFNGKQYYITGKTQKEADRKAALRLDKLKRGEIGINSNMTVKRWCEEWLTTYKKATVTDKVYDGYESMIRNYIYPDLGAYGLNDIKDIHLQKILNKLTHLSAARVRLLKILMYGIFTQAFNSDLIAKNPARDLKMPSLKSGKSRAFSEYEKEHILKVIESDKSKWFIFKFLLYTGLRPGETRALLWNHIDLADGYIKVVQAFESGSSKIKAPKTEAGIRVVPITNHILDDLIYFSKSKNQKDYVFKQQTADKPVTPTSLRRLWLSFKKQVDISMGAKYTKQKAKDGKMRTMLYEPKISEDFKLYYLRHTYCTELEIAGIDINVAKTLMGHSDISVTSKIYTHTGKKAIEIAKNKLNNAKNNAN